MTDVSRETPVVHVYTCHHPELSEPLVLESPGEHSDTFIANNAWHYILRTFDVMIDRRAFTIERSIQT